MSRRYVSPVLIQETPVSKVYLTFDTNLKKDAIVKEVWYYNYPGMDSRLTREQASERALNEVNAMEEIIEFLPLILEHWFDGDYLYIAQEYTPGQSLAQLYAQSSSEGLDRLWYTITRTLEGVEYIHRDGWVHGDIHIGNLIWSGIDVVFVGLSSAQPLTKEGEVAEVSRMVDTFCWLAHLELVHPGAEMNWVQEKILAMKRGYDASSGYWTLSSLKYSLLGPEAYI